MSTINPRINITMPSEVAAILGTKAKKSNVSMSKIALELIMVAMERDEDIYYSRIAEKRETKATKWVSHEDAWK